MNLAKISASGQITVPVGFLEILAPELNDRMLADILDLETGVIVNLHIRSGYDMDIIPVISWLSEYSAPHHESAPYSRPP